MTVEDPMRIASLYVGDLHPDVTEVDLAETFGRVGPLLSVHVCRNKISRKSLCYGYVNFWFHCHASTALKCLNHSRLKGNSMRIMWCQRNPIAMMNSNGNLFVKNLDQSITGARLQEIFSKYGTILSCKVAEEKGVSKGFGFVQFESEDSAAVALQAMHDTVLEGKKLYVSKFVKKTERKDEEHSFRNLYVSNLDDDITEDLLKDKFSELGNITTAVIIKDEKGKSKGYGFVHFDAPEDAKRAMETLNGELLGSKNIIVAWARKRAETTQSYGFKCTDRSNQPKTSNLCIKNLNPSVDDRKLKELFSQYGKVVSAKVIRNGDGVSKQFGFVHFLCPDEAKQALNSATGTEFEERTLHVSLAHRKEQQTSKLMKLGIKFPPQPHYISNCQPQDCHQIPHFSSLMPVMQPNQWDLACYQNFGGPFSSWNPFQVQDFQGIFNTFPLLAAALDEYRQFNHAEYQIKPFGQLQNKFIGNKKVQKEYHKRHGHMCPPPFPNLQQGLQRAGMACSWK